MRGDGVGSRFLLGNRLPRLRELGAEGVGLRERVLESLVPIQRDVTEDYARSRE